MREKNKIYVQDLDDTHYKSILEKFACTDCGFVPYYKLEPQIDGTFDINFKLKKWEKIDNQTKCPQCMRRIKIKKIKENI